MKLIDALKNINKSKEFQTWISSNFMENEFDIDVYNSPYDEENWENQERLTCYYLFNWFCTDSEVGYRVYFFDDKPVAISSQQGRKWREEVEWVSKECFDKVKDYVLSFVTERNYNITLIEDLEAEIGEGYRIEFYEQLFKHHFDNVVYNNERVKIVDFKEEYGQQINNNPYERDTVQIEYENGEKELVNLIN